VSDFWKNRLIQAGLTLFWGSVIVLLMLTYASESPFWETRAHLPDAISVAPQGWAFFTRDPREATKKVYVEQRGEWNVDQRFYAGSRSLSELFKRNRLVQVELANVLQQVGDDEWMGCEETRAACTARPDLPEVDVRNTSNMQQFCGRFLIEKQPPVPWAWARSADSIYMPSELVVLDVACDGPGPATAASEHDSTPTS
jgi:antimicrobial peptide system SdpA family protein